MGVVVLGAMVLSGDAAAGPGRLVAWIVAEENGRHVAFTGMASSREEMRVSYRLNVLRISPGGTSRSAQSGARNLAGGNQPSSLSSVALNIDATSAYALELIVTAPDGREVSATISTPPDAAL